MPLHYRLSLRGTIGFLNDQKKSKSKRLFLTQGTSKTDNFELFVKVMTQIEWYVRPDQTRSCQKMSLTRMKLAHARMTHIPRSMMKIIIIFVDTSSFSTVTSSCQKTSLTRMKLGHASMTHIPSSTMKIIINLVDTS